MADRSCILAGPLKETFCELDLVSTLHRLSFPPLFERLIANVTRAGAKFGGLAASSPAQGERRKEVTSTHRGATAGTILVRVDGAQKQLGEARGG